MKTLKMLIPPLLIVAGVTLFSLLSGRSGILLHFGESSVRVSLPKVYEFSLDYGDINAIRLEALPEEGELVSGGERWGVRYGRRRSDAWGEYDVCVTEASDRCVVVETDGGVYVFSYERTQSTEAMYDGFCELLAERGLLPP